MSDIISPVQVETAIRDVANRMATGVKVCSDRYAAFLEACLLYTSPSPRDKRQSRMPSSA